VVGQVQENPHLRQSDFPRLSLGLLKRGEIFLPPVSVSETEITKMLYQHPRVITRPSTNNVVNIGYCLGFAHLRISSK